MKIIRDKLKVDLQYAKIPRHAWVIITLFVGNISVSRWFPVSKW